MDLNKLLKGMAKSQNLLLVPHIDRFLEEQGMEDWTIKMETKKQDDGFYHPSTHTLISDRKLWFNRFASREHSTALGQKIDALLQGHQKIGASLRRTFAVGHMWHCYMQEILVRMEYVVPSDVEYHQLRHVNARDEYHAAFTGSGTIDCRNVYIPAHGNNWIVDFKTMRKQEFESGPNEFTLAKWKAQLCLYGEWEQTTNLLVIAIEKDSPHRLREYPITYSESVVDGIYQKWGRVEAMIAAGYPPDCTHSASEACDLPQNLCSHFVKDIEVLDCEY